MKRFLIVGMLGAFVILLLAINAPYTVNAFVKATPTPTPRATRIRKPKPTATPQPVAPQPDSAADSAKAAEISPTAPGAMTSTIIVFNPDTSGSAIVQIEIYNSAGSIAHTTTETISPNGAKLITLPGALGTNFQGSAVISSDKNVLALALAANGSNSARDAYESMNAPATNLTIPFARHLAMDTQNSILAIHNTTASSADAQITFYNADGDIVNQQSAVLSANQPLYLNTNSIFPNGTFVGSIKITASQNIVAALQARYYQDTASLRALTAGEQDTTVFLNRAERKLNAASVAVNWSEIFARNSGANPANITLELFDAAGASLGTHTTPNPVPPNGSAQFFLNEPAFASLGNNYVGYARVTSSEPLGASALSVLNGGRRLTEIDGLANAQLKSRYVCGDTARTPTQNSQLTLLNTEARNAKVLVRLYDPNTGAKLVQTKIILPPNAVTTVKLSDVIFAAAGTNFQGMTIVQARGATPPKIVASVANPYGSKKLTGTTGYLCSAIP